MSEYTLKAKKLLKDNSISFTVKYLGESIPEWDNKSHSEYLVRFRNKKTDKSMSVHFYQSLINAGQEPSAYDVLACLTKYDVGSIDDFISEFGYEINSWKEAKKIEKTYKAVKKEYAGILRVFPECLESLREIA